MFTQLSLNRFKCFAEKQEIPLYPVTFLYGLNGRGKSSIIQSLLLLSQNMRANNNVDLLSLKGELINLGAYSDILNAYATQNNFTIDLKYQTETNEDTLSLQFSDTPDTPFAAQMTDIVVNGQSRSDSLTSLNPQDKESARVTTTSSDSVCLQMLKDIRYIAANRLGVSNTEDRLGSNVNITPQGGNVLNILATAHPTFVAEVKNEMSKILSGASITLNTKPDSVELYLDSADKSQHQYKPMNVGFGYGYVLPTIVQTLSAKPNSLLIIENPESHLHPGAQSRLIEFLIRKSVERNLQLIIESHSDHIVNGLRVAVKNGIIPANKTAILHFEREADKKDTPKMDNILIDIQGNLSMYPDDFMDEWTKQLEQLMR